MRYYDRKRYPVFLGFYNWATEWDLSLELRNNEIDFECARSTIVGCTIADHADDQNRVPIP